MLDAATMASTGVTLADNATGVDICQTVTTKEYGVIECLTINDTIAASSLISLKLKSTG